MMEREILIQKGRRLREDYERQNRPKPEQVAGIPMYIPVEGEEVYCLHYPSRHRRNGPVLFDIHGGGFLWAYPEEDDLFCKNVNETLDIEVYSLDYKRAPEHMFPGALYGLYDAIKYMVEHAGAYNFDPEQMGIAGHSSGGNFAAAIVLMCGRRSEFFFQCQLLDYPYVDLREGALTEEMCREDPVLSFELMDFFRICYTTKADESHMLCSPICARQEELAGLPPAVLMTCGNDVLRFQGREYARLLTEANVPVLFYEYPDVNHGFNMFEGPEMKAGQDFVIRGLRFFMQL